MGARRFAWVPLAAALVGALLAAPSAQATFHLIKIREVYPAGDASYVELQMYSAGQYLVAGRHLGVYNSDGSEASNFTLPNNVSATSRNNATVLIADSGYSAAFPSGPAADELDTSLNLSAAGGAVCWVEGSPPDCVAWGNFTGPLPSHIPEFKVGNPVSPAGVTAGQAIRRTIAPGCPTLLEATDDSDNSATDLSEQTPNPRDNASPITEMACTAPTTTIDTKPANPTKETSAHFTYHSTPTGATFKCKLDTGLFESCEAGGVTYTGPLPEGSHTFEVEATNVNGTGTPAIYTWTVDTTPPEVEIKTHPADPSPGNSAAFTYSSSETGSTFQCSLEPTGEAAVFTSCPSTGKTYPDAEHPAPLADGEWTFEVRATDKAGNQSTPEPFPMGTFSWTVDNSLVDTTPPETTIVSKPPDPSESPIASFTYESNEPGSSFECELDSAGFASCPAAGITYTGLVEGPHAFQVRAIDPSGNVDLTPAGYSFEVVAVPGPGLNQPQATLPPETRILARPPARTRDRTPTFRFASSAVATFQCRLDRRPYRSCRSPFTTRALGLGRHTFAVRAVAGQLADPTPARIRFKVVRR